MRKSGTSRKQCACKTVEGEAHLVTATAVTVMKAMVMEARVSKVKVMIVEMTHHLMFCPCNLPLTIIINTVLYNFVYRSRACFVFNYE